MSQQIAETIKFTIRQDGTVTEEVIGVVGNGCQGLTRNIEEKLGEVQRVEHKPSYYQNKETVNVDQPLTKWR